MSKIGSIFVWSVILCLLFLDLRQEQRINVLFEHSFSSSSGPGDSQTIHSNDSDGPALISTLDLQRELNRRDPKLKLVEDGVYGNATRAAHEQALGNQYAIELWPEKTK